MATRSVTRFLGSEAAARSAKKEEEEEKERKERKRERKRKNLQSTVEDYTSGEGISPVENFSTPLSASIVIYARDEGGYGPLYTGFETRERERERERGDPTSAAGWPAIVFNEITKDPRVRAGPYQAAPTPNPFQTRSAFLPPFRFSRRTRSMDAAYYRQRSFLMFYICIRVYVWRNF